ncbi:MAG: DUF58 domain-containing protein [Thermoguttaceae bacterium]
MQDVSELLKKVRRTEIVAKRAVNDLFAGQYKSVFRGRGMEFSEVREYQPGDDIRSIDWNVTARAGKPFIKRFVEERELTILFAVDISASGIFGSSHSKFDTAIEVAATLMFSALKNNDKVGLLTFASDVVRYYRPRKGKANVLHLIRELLAVEPIADGTNLQKPLQYINRVQKRRAVIFLLSDFLVPEWTSSDDQETNSDAEGAFSSQISSIFSQSSRIEQNILFRSMRQISRGKTAGQQSRELSICARKHDLIAMTISDTREKDFPDVGLITLQDAETGELIEVDTSSSLVRNRLAAEFQNAEKRISDSLKRSQVDQLPIETNQDFLINLRRFFTKRGHRH